MVSLRYYLRFKNEDWSEVGALVQSSNTSPFNVNLCSTAWMSTINTASFVLKYTGTTLYHQIVDKLISAQTFKDDVMCRITDVDGNVLFYGTLDLNKLELSSAKIPLSLSLSANDHMKKLDAKIGKNAIFKVGRKMMDVVAWMMEDAGLPPVTVWADGSDSILLETPVVFTEDSDDKYLDVVNKLLQELGGYTIVSDPSTQTFHVRKVGKKSDAGNIPTVSYMVSSRLKSGSSLFSNDGVVVKYRNVKESGQELVYMQNISIKDEILRDPDGKYDTNGNRIPNSKDGTKAIPLGDVVGVGGYFPLDSDVTKTYQEYDSSLFDYSLQQKKTRKANSELGIYYVDPTTVEVKMIASDKEGNDLKSTWYENVGFHSDEGGFDYEAGGKFYPKKAWQIFRNKLDECVNVKSLIIEGKAVFSDREYSLVMPMSAKDPYEYTSSYISTKDTALNLSTLLTNVKKHGGDTSSWTAPWGAYALGQEVYVEHPSASKVRAIVVKKTMKVIGGQLWCEYVAVHNGSWEEAREYAFSGDSQSAPSYDPYVQAVANGYQGARNEYEESITTKVFTLDASSRTFYYNKRVTDGTGNTIRIDVDVSGYAGYADVTCITEPSYYNKETGILFIPYATIHESIVMKATLEGAEPIEISIEGIDDTEYRKYFGKSDADPTFLTLVKDHYFNSTTNKIRYKSNDGWTDLTSDVVEDQDEYARILSNAMGDAIGSIAPDSVTSSYYGYFNTLISKVIQAETLYVDAANIRGQLKLSDINGEGIQLTKDGISAVSSDGKSNWSIKSDGTAVFSNAEVKGEITAKKVTHDALNTVDEVSGDSVGTDDAPMETDLTVWNLSDAIDELREGYIDNGRNYAGSSINGVPVAYAVVTTIGAEEKVVAPPVDTSLSIGTTYTDSRSIGSKSSNDVVYRLDNDYSYPIWVDTSSSLGGSFNGIYTRIHRTSGGYTQYPEDASVMSILMPGEGVSIHAHSDALWGSNVGYGTVKCLISSGYAESTTPHLLFDTQRTYGGGEANEHSTSYYLPIGTLVFDNRSRYLGVTYQGELSNLYYKKQDKYIALKEVYSSRYLKVFDLGEPLDLIDLYYYKEVRGTATQTSDDEGNVYYEYDYYYTGITVGRFAWTTFSTLDKVPMVIVDSDGNEYKYSYNGTEGLYRSDVIALFGKTIQPTKCAGRKAYSEIVERLGISFGLYDLNNESYISLDNRLFTGLTYMDVGADRITFYNASGSVILFADKELNVVYDQISAYLVLLSSKLGVETAEIRPKKHNTYAIGSEDNIYSRGYFGVVYGAVFN